jgi:hypothetical protein
MGKEQSISNQEKSTNGVSYEKYIYDLLDTHKKIYGINSIKKQQIECGNELKDLICAELNYLEDNGNEITDKVIERIVKRYIKDQKNGVIRTKQKYNKRSDVRCITNGKFIDNEGIKRQIEIIIDTTTSARTDRIKAKAQDAAVYRKVGINEVYIIVVPNDDFYDSGEYKDPNKEKKLCANACYDNNFANLYKDEGISLILREDDLLDFLLYIQKRNNQRMSRVIENFKKYHFKSDYERRKKDLEILEETLITELIKEYE